MTDVRIGFSTKKKNLLSRLIRWFTKSRFSHTWVRYHHPLYKMAVVVEADIKGIVEVPHDEYVKHNDSVTELVPPEGIDLEAALPVLGLTLGRGYDLGSLIGRVWVFFCRWLGKKVKNPFGSPKQDACVESVLRLLAQVDADFRALDAEVQDPQGVFDLLVKKGWKPVRCPSAPSSPIMAAG